MSDRYRIVFGAQLKRHRLQAGLTQEALAERAGLSPKAVSDLERDPARTPRLATVALLAEALGLAPEERTALLAAARPGDATGRMGSAPRFSFPRPLTPLIGRAGVAAAIVEILRAGESRVLSLTGPGGVGKTRLAIAVAGRMTPDFPDGLVFVDLSPLRDPALVLDATAEALGVDERDATPLLDRIAVSLSDRRMLLVLDNFEHVLAAAPVVVALVEECREVVALVTSRVSLQVRGAREYPIAPLAQPEPADPLEALAGSPAVELFVEPARSAGVDLPADGATLGVVAEICRRLEGAPLALELAAARVRTLPPAALLGRLGERLPLLVGGAHDLPARQKTMRDAIAWSYDLLEPAERALFRKLCVFIGGCTLDAAEAVCAEPDGAAVIDGLTALVNGSLVRVRRGSAADRAHAAEETARVDLLETVREYGLERVEAEAEAVRGRHAAFYLDLAERARSGLVGPKAPAWLARLDADDGNLRAALGWANERADGATCLRLGAALWPFWDLRGHLTEGREWLRRALERSREDPAAHGARVDALVGAATLAIRQAAYEEAARSCDEAVRLARERRAGSPLVAALNARGLLAREQDRYTDAARDHAQARSLARDADDAAGEAVALLGLAYATMFRGNVRDGYALAEEALTIARTLGDRKIMADAMFLRGWQSLNDGAFDVATTLGTETLRLCRVLGDTAQSAEALFMLANVELYRGEHEAAARLFGDALSLNRERGDENRLSRDLAGLAAALTNLGDLVGARSLAEESLLQARRHLDRWSTAMSLTLVGHVDLAEGGHERAADRFAEAAALFQAIGNPIYLPWCLEGLAGIAAARGDHERSAFIVGAREGVRARLGMLLPPLNQSGHARTLALAREALSREAFDAARADGQARPLEEAIAVALADA